MSTASDVAEGPIDLVLLWTTLWRRRWLIAAASAVSLVLATALAFSIKPVYRAEVLLVPVSDEGASGMLSRLSGQFGGLASLAGLSLEQGDGRKAESIATLESRALTEAFVSELDLLPVLFEDKWDFATRRWKPMAPKDVPTLWDANKMFSKEIRKVDENKKTGLVTLSIEWTDPKLAAEWAAGLVVRTNELLRTRALERAERNRRFLQEQLQQTSVVEVRQSIYTLLEVEIKSAMLAQNSDEYAFKVIDPPVIPEEKARPKRSLIMAIGLVAGLLVSCTTILLARAIKGLGSAGSGR